MRVKAKGNVRDASGWHRVGEVFITDEDLGDAVEVLDAPKQAEKKQEPVAEREPETEAESTKETVKPRSASRRRKAE